MCIATILYVATELVLPIDFLIFQSFSVPHFHLFDYLNRNIGVATPITTIVLAQTPHLFLNLLFMVTVPLFKGGLTLPNILTPTSTTSSQVDYETAGTIYLLSYPVGLSCICAGECAPLLYDGAGYPALAAF